MGNKPQLLILPGTGRGTAMRSIVVEGERGEAIPLPAF